MKKIKTVFYYSREYLYLLLIIFSVIKKKILKTKSLSEPEINYRFGS